MKQILISKTQKFPEAFAKLIEQHFIERMKEKMLNFLLFLTSLQSLSRWLHEVKDLRNFK